MLAFGVAVGEAVPVADPDAVGEALAVVPLGVGRPVPSPAGPAAPGSVALVVFSCGVVSEADGTGVVVFGGRVAVVVRWVGRAVGLRVGVGLAVAGLVVGRAVEAREAVGRALVGRRLGVAVGVTVGLRLEELDDGTDEVGGPCQSLIDGVGEPTAVPLSPRTWATQ